MCWSPIFPLVLLAFDLLKYSVIRCLYIHNCSIFLMGWPRFIRISFHDFVFCCSFDCFLLASDTYIPTLFPFTWDIFFHHFTVILLLPWNLLSDETLKNFPLDQEKKQDAHSFSFTDRISCSPGWPWRYYIAKDGPELLIFLAPLPECWYPYLGYEVPGIKPKASCVVGKCELIHTDNAQEAYSYHPCSA